MGDITQQTPYVRVPTRLVITALITVIAAGGSLLVDIYIFDDALALDKLKEEVRQIQIEIADIRRDDDECEEHQQTFDHSLNKLMIGQQELRQKMYEFQPEVRANIRNLDSLIRDCIRRTQ